MSVDIAVPELAVTFPPDFIVNIKLVSRPLDYHTYDVLMLCPGTLFPNHGFLS